MRLYPKKLRNIDDLELELKSLQKQARKLDKEELLSLEGLTGGGKKKPKDKEEEERGGGSIVDMLPISNPIVSTLLSLVEKRLLSNKSSSKQPKAAYIADAVAGKGKSILFKVAKEVIGGYLKWKAIELSYKGAKKIAKKLKQKRAERVSAATSCEL